jgi:histone-binding protein RBBP4
MPQNHFIVATRGPSPQLYIWDVTKHSSFPDEKSPFCPQGVCVGHSKEGYALAWSPHTEGSLLSGSDDTTVQLWDARAAYAKGAESATQIHPVQTFAAHTATVEDVAWHGRDAHMMGSVGDDQRLCLWDVRNDPKNTPVQNIENAHESDINCLAFNPINEYLLATGCADSTIAVWDIRNMTTGPMSKLLGHSDQVFKVEWAPFNESILGSCSADRRVGLWDLSRIGQEQTPEDAEDGPPELLFLHGGHTSKVSDFAWNPVDEWSIASVSEDNVLQVWNPAEEIYAADDDEGDADDDKAEDGILGEDELE